MTRLPSLSNEPYPVIFTLLQTNFARVVLPMDLKPFSKSEQLPETRSLRRRSCAARQRAYLVRQERIHLAHGIVLQSRLHTREDRRNLIPGHAWDMRGNLGLDVGDDGIRQDERFCSKPVIEDRFIRRLQVLGKGSRLQYLGGRRVVEVDLRDSGGLLQDLGKDTHGSVGTFLAG